MKEPFYFHFRRRDWFLHEASTWMGTPFHRHGHIKGAGVDCVQLAIQIYRATGFLGAIKVPEYNLDAGHHLAESQLEAVLREIPNFESVPVDTTKLLTGDLLVMQVGRVTHHVGVVTMMPRFIHAMLRLGVIESDLRDPSCATRVRKILRPVIP